LFSKYNDGLYGENNADFHFYKSLRMKETCLFSACECCSCKWNLK